MNTQSIINFKIESMTDLLLRRAIFVLSIALFVLISSELNGQAFRDIVPSGTRPDWEVKYDDCTGEALVRVLVFREESPDQAYDDYMEELTIFYLDNNGNEVEVFQWEKAYCPSGPIPALVCGLSEAPICDPNNGDGYIPYSSCPATFPSSRPTNLPFRGTHRFSNSFGDNIQVFAWSYDSNVVRPGSPGLLFPDVITDPTRKFWHYVNVVIKDLPDDLFGKLTKVRIRGKWDSRSNGIVCCGNDETEDTDFSTSPFDKNAENSINTSTNVQLKIDPPSGLNVVGSVCTSVRLEWINPSNISTDCPSSPWGVQVRRSDGLVLDGLKNGFVIDNNPLLSATYTAEAYFKPNATRLNISPAIGPPLTVNQPILIDGPNTVNASDDRADQQCDKKISLSWSPVAGAGGYRVLRNGGIIKEVDGTTTSTSDDTPPLSQPLNYTVQVKNSCDAYGASSTPVIGYSEGDPMPPSTVNIEINSTNNGFNISWNNSSNFETGYIIERTFPGGGSAFVFERDADVTSLSDTEVVQCVNYTYTVKVKSECNTDGIGDESASAILAPDLSGTFATDGTGLIASKGRYTDKVELSWINNNEGQTNTVKIFRRILESGDPFVLLTTLSSSSGIYNDIFTDAGELYEYEIVAEGPCENTIVPSNRVQAIGFRRKTGIVTGKVTYSGGVNVANVKITAVDPSNNSFPSLDFAGGTEVATIAYDASLDAENEFIMETWFKPESYAQSFKLMSRAGSYELSYDEPSGRYKASIVTDDGANEIFVDQSLFPIDTWNHIAGMLYQDSLSILVNGSVKSRIPITGTPNIIDAGAGLVLGMDFVGNLKELRIWGKGKDDLRMSQDYSRFLAGNEEDLRVYLNAGERKGMFAYDFSRVGSSFNNNHAQLGVPGMWDDSDSPDSLRLTIAAFTNEDGEYNLIVPFSGAGQNFVLKPVFGQHRFAPSTRPVFIGDGATVQNNIDFEDISSFRTTGTVIFDGTNCPSANVLVKIDGEPVIKDGNAVLTDETGFFDINVPIGRHVITLERSGHVFNAGRFPPEDFPEEEWDFQETQFGLEFSDSTFRKVIGRVVGGDREGDKVPGLGRSQNNIGVATIQFEPKNGCFWINPIENFVTATTVDTSGEYEISLPPLEYKVPRPEIASNDGLEVISSANVTLDLRNLPFDMTVIDTLTLPDSTYRVDSVSFHKKFDFIYKAPPTVDITMPDGSPFVGDDEFIFTHSKFDTDTINLLTHPMPFPVFTQNRTYTTLLSTFEEYINKDGGLNIIDRVPITDGIVNITNNLAIESSINFNLNDFEDYDGDTLYTFIGGQPNIATNSTPAFNYTKVFEVDLATGPLSDSWLPNDEIFRGYVMGVRDVEESDFTTQGPELVDYILRDPPGSQSFAERTVGITTSTESSFEWNVGGGVDVDKTVYGGTKFNLGIGYSTTTEIEATVNIGLKTETSGGEGQTIIETITNEFTWTTSDSPLLAGANSDLFIGTSRNYLFGVATYLEIVPNVACGNSNIDCLGPNVNGYHIATNKNLALAGDDFETEFIYTAAHIETYEIPQLIELRNFKLENDPKYTMLADSLSTCYGANNDDIRWGTPECPTSIAATPDPILTTLEDYTGPSYTFTPVHQDTIIDSVRMFNQQIRLWEEALAFNEEQKVLAVESPVNYSYAGGGSSFSSSITNTSSFAETRTFEFMFNESLGFKVGGKIAGAGFDDTYSVSLSQKRSEVETETTEDTQKVGFTISDDSEFDDFTFDVYEGSDRGGPIFKVLGGRTSCPHEAEVKSKYYEPGTVLSPGTIRLEQPEISISPSIVRNVPQDESAVIQMTLTNNNQVGETWEFATQLIAESNLNSLSVNVGSSDDLTRNWVIPPLGSITRDIFADIGTVYDYDSLLVVMHSTCQYQRGQSAEVDIADSAYFSVYFIPDCTDIEIENPTDQWVVNNSYDDTLNVRLGGYNYNYLNLKDIQFQYKLSSESEEHWLTQKVFYVVDTLDEYGADASPIPDDTPYSLYEWDISSLQDGEYDFRAISNCVVAENESEIHRGYIDTENPHAFGTPSPADGILDPEDDIIIRFNEDIDPAYITSDFNIDIRGKLNGTTIRQQESLAFDGTSDFGEIPEYQLQSRSFTIEFWARRDGTGQEVVLSQGISTQDQLVVGFNSSNQLYLQLEDEISNSNEPISDNDWHFYAIVYDRNSRLVRYFVDNDPAGQIPNFLPEFNSTGPIFIGKNGSTDSDYFQGKLQEIRLWSTVRDQGSIGVTSDITLSGREPGLIGNWPLDDSWGLTANEKVRGRHMQLTGATWNVEPDSHTYELDGTSEYLKVVGAGTLSTTPEQDISIEAWFKTSGGGTQTILSNGVPSASQPSWWSISVNPAGHLLLENSGNSIETSMEVDDDSWHHFSLVVERGFAISLYLDGNLVETDNATLFGDFGGVELILGAQVDGVGTTATFSQYFDGHLDDVRIWNIARTPEQVGRDFINQLTGDEPGLLAYYPFDFYEEIIGVPTLLPTLEDQVIDTVPGFNLTAVGGVFSTTRPSIKLPRKVKKVPKTYSVNGDELFIDLNIDPAEIENVTLDITVEEIRDFAGNRMESPEVWIAYIDKNQVFWDTEYFQFEKDLEDDLTFTATIRNTGGSQEAYTISNLPDWLIADQLSGIIDPNSTVDVEFTFMAPLNIGEYEQDIYVTTDFGFNERLLIDLKVSVDPPTWTVDPGQFSHSMNIVGQLEINDVISTDDEDIVSVWVDEELRGVANVEFDESTRKYLVFLTILSNVSSGESIEFRAWDASRGRELVNLIPNDMIFVTGAIEGTRSNPLPIQAQANTILTYDLTAGWNWISFPLASITLDDVNATLEDLSPAVNDNIKYLSSFNTYDGSSWVGNLPGFDTDKGYKIYVTEADTFQYEGVFLDPTTDPIQIDSGWTWISVKSEFLIDLTSALSSLVPQTGDVIKGQRNFAIYEDGFGWGGNLDFLVPQEGYMIKYHTDTELTFFTGSGSNAIWTGEEEILTNIDSKSSSKNSTSTYSPGIYSSNMSMTATLDSCLVNGLQENPMDLSEWSLVAKVDGEWRGTSQSQWIPSLNKYLYYISIEGDESAIVDFTLVNNNTNHEELLSHTITYQSNSVLGSPLNPYLFDCSSAGPCATNVFFRTTDIPEGDDAVIIQASSLITSDAQLPGPREFQFLSGEAIEFTTNFEVFNGAVLQALIQDCIN